MDHKNTNISSNNFATNTVGEEGEDDRYLFEEDTLLGGGGGGVAIHSQVMKIKQEYQKIKHPSLEQVEISTGGGGVRKMTNRQRSRSPLGLAHDQARPISVGN